LHDDAAAISAVFRNVAIDAGFDAVIEGLISGFRHYIVYIKERKMDVYQTIAYAGSVVAGIRLFPQVYKSIQTQFVGMSMGTLLLDLTSCILFLIYAIHTNAVPIIMSNVTSTLANLILIGIVARKKYTLRRK